MILQLVIVLAGTVISGVVGYLLSDRTNTRRALRGGFASAALGSVLLTVVMLQFELSALRQLRLEIVAPNVLEQLRKELSKSPSSSPMRASMVARKDRLEQEISTIIKGKLKLYDEDEVTDEWSRLFQEAATAVDATNYVSPDFWLDGSEFSARQYEVQNLARQHGVAIRRIFIFAEGSAAELQQIRTLARQQEELGISVRHISYSRVLETTAYAKYSPQLDGAIDFVIYDFNSVLLTFPQPMTRGVASGILTKERPVVDAARDLFERLWVISSDVPR